MKKRAIVLLLSFFLLPLSLLAQTGTNFTFRVSVTGGTGTFSQVLNYNAASGRYEVLNVTLSGLSTGSFNAMQVRLICQEGSSAPVFNQLLPLSSFMAQPCATDEVSISLDPNAVDVENPESEDYFYNLTFECSESRRPCSRLEYDGDDLAAGAVLYFDNSGNVFNSGEVYVSVASVANAAIAELSASYNASADTWYRMDEIGNGLYMATVTGSMAAARVSFWNGDYSGGVTSGAVAFFNLPYDGENPEFLPAASSDYADADEWCGMDGVQSAYYSVLGSWVAGPPSASITSSRAYIDASYDESFTLTANLTSGNAVSYKWQYRSESGTDYTDLEVTSVNTYDVQSANYPGETTLYRVLITLDDGTILVSNTVTVTFASSCGGNSTPVIIFKEDFGTVPADYNGYNGDGKRYKYRADPQGNSGYTYAPYPQRINDGMYALVADPYYAGCGEGSGNVEECITEPRTTDESGTWFRDYYYPYSASNAVKFRDHTLKQQIDEAKEFGLCLLINYKAGNSSVEERLAYERDVTDEEKQNMTPGSMVRLTAYVASAAKYQAGDNTIMESVTMTIAIQFRPDGGEWTDLVSQETTVLHHDNWMPIVTDQFPLGWEDGDYRVRIYSSGEGGGNGNDVLIDDIRLEVCRPSLRLFWEDEEGKTSTSENMAKADDSFSLLVPHFDEAALGESPCVMLFLYGQNGYEAYLGDFNVSKNDAGENEYRMVLPDTYINSDGNELKLVSTVPGAWSFAAIATTEAVCQDPDLKKQLIEDVIGGNVDPSTADDCVGSNVVDLITECAAAPLLPTDAETSLCLDDPADFVYPVLNLAFDYFSDEDITYTLYQDGNIVTGAENISLASALQTGEVEINLADYAEALAWQPGSSHILYVDINEIYEGTQICPRRYEIPFSIGITPQINGVLQDVDFCRGEQASVTANVSNATELLWQQSTDGGVTWVAAEGVNNTPTYEFPEGTASGTQYKLIATNRAGNLVCGPVESNVFTVTVSNAVAPVVTDYNECAVEGSKQLSDLASGYEGSLVWYGADGTELQDASFPTDAAGEYVYQVKAVDGECESGLVSVNVTIKQAVEEIELGIEPEDQPMSPGATSTVTLTVTPDNAGYSAAWTVNDATLEVQGNTYSEQPEQDRHYRVVVTDECGNSFSAEAKAQVSWPTIITPYTQDGLNDAFLEGSDIHLKVVDRYGNVVYDGDGGWPQPEASKQQPGVYYYIATMPDGTVRNGTVELYR